MISLCMIVKNEEKNLQNCLMAVTPFINEIVIVDTGSTDNTKEVARKFTDKIYNFKWCDDFSKARNFSIEMASNDWILILDADEVINNFDSNSILKFINNDKNFNTVGRIEIINFLENNKIVTERVSRLFNKNYFHYEGIIHEQITALNAVTHSSIPVNIKVDHFGYTKELVEKTNKITRNIKLLKKAVENNFEDSYYHYQLGKTYYLDKQHIKALYSFQRAIKYMDGINYYYSEDLIVSYGYSLLNTENFSKALELEKYDMYYGASADFNFLMGLIYMNNGKFKDSIKTFLKCIDIKECKGEGTNSYLAYYNIGVIYECLNLKDKSVEYYKMCKDYKPALERLKNTY